ncbi:hypothetical protein [Rhodococcus spongiicola]|uniref:hypothetical protein n=1 Tax=Rhodococcus spongiicola TaxID=2487352 RepID=UPI000FDF3A78|nr:hypothetical protein [Rhodococcus spongiicola]
MSHSVRKRLIGVAATLSLVAGGFGIAQASATPVKPGVQATQSTEKSDGRGYGHRDRDNGHG